PELRCSPDKPGFIAGQMLLTLIPDPLRWPIGGADADSGEAGFERALRPGPPAHRLPFGSGQLPASIEYPGHAADAGDPAWQRARADARRRGTPSGDEGYRPPTQDCGP